MEHSKKAKTLMETLIVILIIAILSCFLIPTAYGVYRLFSKMIVNEYSDYYKDDPEAKWKRESDAIMYNRGWRK
tara:strand:- start:2246 stop:2467 length:222 start_codon:yes stop_codon:yes gene_type:complete